ncbi:MAG: sigma-70 family RNA polymerase sigma factor [Bacteroidetes bacterium]|nr:sigma-70 family RNA polymerase sigma factor [Bacteroidota bacterium]
MPDNLQINQLVDHLFRRESGKLTSVLTRIFGSENIELAEDVVQDALSEAMNQWTYKGIPDNPSGWLYRVAKNKALNILEKEKSKKKYSSSLQHTDYSDALLHDDFLSDAEIKDDQLRMMFICCHPSLSADSQIAFILKTLCGFSVSEIARAFLSNEESIHKRLVRARQKIREAGIRFELPERGELQKRVETILQTIYLLFNEGYSASGGEYLIRYELCEESIRLTEILATHQAIEDKSDVYALLSLMHFNASRFYARQDEAGNIFPMSLQDRSKWNRTLIEKASYYLEKNSLAESVSSYHILAVISAHHCAARDFDSTNWKTILFLYDSLLQIDRSPIVHLNRSVALSKVRGPLIALEELLSMQNDPLLTSYYLFHATKAELYLELDRFAEAATSFTSAMNLAPMKAEKDLLQRKLSACLKRF